MIFNSTLWTACLAFCLPSVTSAALVAISLNGNTDIDEWSAITAANNPGFPGYMSPNPWPSAIGSNGSGSGDATFMRNSGYAYPGGAGVYTPSGTSAFTVADSTALTNLANLVFQVDIGSGDYDFASGQLPVLTLYDSSSQVIGTSNMAASYNARVAISGAGTMGDPFRTTWALQWDLSAYSGISYFDLTFSAAEHSQIYGLQVNQGDAFSGNIVSAMAVPEPSVTLLGIMGLVPLILRRRRR